MWIQHLKVGLWLTGNNDNLVVENNRILDTTADGLNLNRLRQGRPGAQQLPAQPGRRRPSPWSLYSRTPTQLRDNTISQPNLANGIAVYGGTDIAVRDNLVSDTNALGSGIAISNQKFLDPFHPLAGTITVAGNTLVRTGAMNSTGTIRWARCASTPTTAPSRRPSTSPTRRSPTARTSAFEFVSGGGRGHPVKNVTVAARP